eukprot:s3216_g6.t1
MAVPVKKKVKVKKKAAPAETVTKTQDVALRQRCARLLQALLRIEAWQNSEAKDGADLETFAMMTKGCAELELEGLLEAPIYSNSQIEAAWLFLFEVRRRHFNRRMQIQACMEILEDAKAMELQSVLQRSPMPQLPAGGFMPQTNGGPAAPGPGSAEFGRGKKNPFKETAAADPAVTPPAWPQSDPAPAPVANAGWPGTAGEPPAPAPQWPSAPSNPFRKEAKEEKSEAAEMQVTPQDMILGSAEGSSTLMEQCEGWAPKSDEPAETPKEEDKATFESLGVCEETVTSRIQQEAIPWALQGRDIIGLAETGSGKTGAFALPIVQRLLDDPQRFYAVCLAPTRELCVQIGEQFEAIGSTIKLQTATVVGGLAMVDQAMALAKRPHVVVATPGRLVDHLENTKGFHLKTVKYLVMDEADRLLSMDFDEALDKILEFFFCLSCGPWRPDRRGGWQPCPQFPTVVSLPSEVFLAPPCAVSPRFTGKCRVSGGKRRAPLSPPAAWPLQRLGISCSAPRGAGCCRWTFLDCCRRERRRKRRKAQVVSSTHMARLPGHHYLEGYFHTLPMDLAVPSPNVRSGAADAAKPPAPQRLAAFGEALRRKNRRLLEELAEQCPAGSPLRAVLGSDRVFGDLAVQIHWGDAVEDQDVAWHVDANNSALHMAVSLRGRRTLQMRLCDPFALETKVVQEPQQPGDVYIGNPAAYEHGLTYAAATWEKRMVALQLRLLLTEAELRDAHFLEGMALVARRVSTAPFELPSLEDVRNCLSTRS